jgi:uncharacterized membrane protein YsdA (DUF1294 family)
MSPVSDIRDILGRMLPAVYLLAVNIVSFCQIGADKKLAKTGQRRIREKVMFLTAAIGGSIGANLGMAAFRHKTKHKSFVIGMPVLLIVHIVIAVVLIKLL